MKALLSGALAMIAAYRAVFHPAGSGRRLAWEAVTGIGLCLLLWVEAALIAAMLP